MNWKLVKFKDIFDFEKKSKIKAGEGLQKGEFPFYTSSNTLTKYLNDFQFNKPCLIFGSGGMPSVHYCQGKFSTSTDCFVVTPKDQNEVFPEYIYFYFVGNMHILEEGFKGAGLKHVSKDYINNIAICLPPIDEQKRIASILAKAQNLVKKQKIRIEKYDVLAQSTFLEIFGDVHKPSLTTMKMIEIVDPSRPITYGILMPGDDVIGGVPYVRVLDIKDSLILTHQLKRTSLNISNQYKRSILKENDLLISIRGHVGRMAIVGKDAEGANITQDTARLAFIKELVDSTFVMKFLEQDKTQDLMRKLTKGAAVKGINLTDLKEIRVPIYDIKIQNRYSIALKNILSQKLKAKKALFNSESLFSALMQKAFNGKSSKIKEIA